MDQIKLLEPVGDSENGRSYYPGVYTLVEDLNAEHGVEGDVMDVNAAQRALNAGVAEPHGGDEAPAEGLPSQEG